MTETAKQDTSKAPAPSAKSGPDATGPDVTAPAGSAATEQAAGQEPDGADSEEKPDLDETKRKFREALERKNHAHNDGQGQGGRDGSKISGAHGPAASRRNFRRKSG